ncbi:MAG: YgiQ family radical SAM protein [Paludibacteraceae bacterium]|nr:YgiQ family radical SAM protein [Paludibacteraceae bacterium]
MAEDLKKYLPTTRKELDIRGWNEVDIIFFSGDAYVDHPQFGAAVIGRVLEAHGYRVALVPQPDWHGDHRDFLKLGRPRLFFGITAGSMDSMVNHYTANKRRRSDDAYTPDGRAGMRPDYCTVTYTRILKQHFPDVPVVIGGIEASMRRLAHYDYWSDSFMPSILVDSCADILVYGMGEKAIVQVADRLKEQGTVPHDVPQTAFRTDDSSAVSGEILRLRGYEEEKHNKLIYAEDFRLTEIESNKIVAKTILQDDIVVNPPFPPMSSEELDAVYDLPFQYLPHPKYAGKRIPAYEMIRFSVCLHRGCFGGCSFCTISAHQGKQIASRSKESIMRQISRLKDLPEWKGYLSDLGGPSANMYGMHGKNRHLCEKCARPSCLQPNICTNLHQNFAPLLDIYRSVDKLPYIKKAFVGSGIRYDLMSEAYGRQLITRHVSGRLKVAPEHCSDQVLRLMRKPQWKEYLQFRDFFNKVNREAGMHQQLIPYFISSHPGCTTRDMAALAEETKRMNYHPEQVQDFTPTPMTLSTCMYYTGVNPYTMEQVFVAKDKNSKQQQNKYFFWWKKNNTISTR